MTTASIVMIVHFCTVVAHSPFLTDCSTHVFPKKSMEHCLEAKKSWDTDKGYKRYFTDDRKTIADGENAIVGPIHCEKDPEANFVPLPSNVKIKSDKT